MFIKDDYMLESDLAKKLYKEVQDVPVLECFSNISPRTVFKNEPYKNITEIMIDNDVFMQRFMRHSGVLEYQITGDESDEGKFQAFATALEKAYLHPQYTVSHMTLKKYFDVSDNVSFANASSIYKSANNIISDNDFSPRDALRQTNTELLTMTADVCDDLEYFTLLSDNDECEARVLPIFNVDSVMDVNSDQFFDTVTLLEKQTQTTISGITTLATALIKRLDFFQEKNCVMAEHRFMMKDYMQVPRSTASKILKKRLMKYNLTSAEVMQLQLYLLKFFLKEYAIRDIAVHIHIGFMDKQLKRVGMKGEQSYDFISTSASIDALRALLEDLDGHYPLPKMILYGANPADWDALAVVSANFSCQAPGNIQIGVPQGNTLSKRNLQRFLDIFGSYLNISSFIGFSSGTGSPTSMVQHDYFRRYLCNYIAEEANHGRIPRNEEALIQLIKDIAYNNARYYYDL
jgi:glucuronate isomerase